MAWYLEIILGLVISSGFMLGGLLYVWSNEELDSLFGWLKKVKNTKTILLIKAIIFGIIFSVILKTAWKEIISLLLFIFILIFSSIAFVGDDKITVVKYASASTLLFFVSFLIVYLIS